jgi:hypothetical protein
MEKRKIKIISSNLTNNNDEILDPNNLGLITNDNTFVLTKNYILNNQLVNTKIIPNNKFNLKTVDSKLDNHNHNRKYMLYPSVILSSESILQLYEIETIDDLIETVNNYIKNNKNFYTINRILNVFIKNNLDDLKKNNGIINKIIIDLLNNYYPEFKNNEKKIIDYIKLWFKNQNENDFYFDLFNNIIKFLS